MSAGNNVWVEMEMYPLRVSHKNSFDLVPNHFLLSYLNQIIRINGLLSHAFSVLIYRASWFRDVPFISDKHAALQTIYS